MKFHTAYNAYIQVNYQHINLGTYRTYEEAVAAREEAEKKYYNL